MAFGETILVVLLDVGGIGMSLTTRCAKDALQDGYGESDVELGRVIACLEEDLPPRVLGVGHDMSSLSPPCCLLKRIASMKP